MNFVEKYYEPVRTPPALVSGDLIGVAAPASPFNRSRFENGVMVLQSMGYQVYLPEGLYERDGYLAGPDRHRADVLGHLLTNPDIKGVVCARGGFGSMKMLPHLDFEKIALSPKVFVGFSDITALLTTLVHRCGWVVFHGPTITALGEADRESIDGLKQAISGRDPVALLAQDGRVLHSGQASGPLLAGNLTTLCHMVGTPFMPSLEGAILLIEDRGEPVYRVDRMLTQLKMAGCFKRLAGLALGSFSECGATAQIENLVSKIFSDTQIPILSGFGVGHDPRNLTVPLGLNASLNTRDRSLRLHSAATHP
jgi:muramoyltetrapeptide carboxypeptidase